jgi:hypothetical protein
MRRILILVIVLLAAVAVLAFHPFDRLPEPTPPSLRPFDPLHGVPGSR